MEAEGPPRVLKVLGGRLSRALGGCHPGGSPGDSVRVSPCAGRRESEWLRANEPLRRARQVGPGREWDWEMSGLGHVRAWARVILGE